LNGDEIQEGELSRNADMIPDEAQRRTSGDCRQADGITQLIM